MFKVLFVFAAFLACSRASKLGFLAPKAYAAAPPALPYINTSPFGYASPYAGRYIAGIPHATYGAKYVAPTAYAAPYVPSYAAAPYAAPPYAAPYAAAFATPYAVPYGGSAYGAPYVGAFRAPHRASYAYGSPVVG